jgi:hypothetical protein
MKLIDSKDTEFDEYLLSSDLSDTIYIGFPIFIPY